MWVRRPVRSSNPPSMAADWPAKRHLPSQSRTSCNGRVCGGGLMRMFSMLGGPWSSGVLSDFAQHTLSYAESDVAATCPSFPMNLCVGQAKARISDANVFIVSLSQNLASRWGRIPNSNRASPSFAHGLYASLHARCLVPQHEGRSIMPRIPGGECTRSIGEVSRLSRFIQSRAFSALVQVYPLDYASKWCPLISGLRCAQRPHFG